MRARGRVWAGRDRNRRDGESRPGHDCSPAPLERARGRSPQTVENAPPATPPQVEHTGRHHARLHLSRPEQCLRGSDVVAGIKHSPTPPCLRTPGLPFATSLPPSCACAGRSEAATHRPTASMQEGRLPHRRSDPARINPRPKSILRARASDSSPVASHPARAIQGPVPPDTGHAKPIAPGCVWPHSRRDPPPMPPERLEVPPSRIPRMPLVMKEDVAFNSS